MLVTSRIPLWVDGEEVVRLEPLPLDAAIELFRARCGVGTDGDDVAVAAICRAVDGLPLAVELAAGLTRSLTVDQVADRIGDRFHLLTRRPPDRRPSPPDAACRRWSGATTCSTTMTVCCSADSRSSPEVGRWTSPRRCAPTSSLDRGTVAPALARLVDASMVTFTDVDGVRRFGMLDTLRHFAGEQLELAGEREPCAAPSSSGAWPSPRHADEDASGAALLEREFANVRGTLDAATDSAGWPAAPATCCSACSARG